MASAHNSGNSLVKLFTCMGPVTECLVRNLGFNPKDHLRLMLTSKDICTAYHEDDAHILRTLQETHGRDFSEAYGQSFAKLFHSTFRQPLVDPAIRRKKYVGMGVDVDAPHRPEGLVRAHYEHVSAVVVSNNGKMIASSSGDNTIKIWEASSGKLLHEISVYTERLSQDYVTSMAFDPTDAHLVSSGRNETVIVWDTLTGEPVSYLSLASNHGAPHAFSHAEVAYADEGRRIISSSIFEEYYDESLISSLVLMKAFSAETGDILYSFLQTVPTSSDVCVPVHFDNDYCKNVCRDAKDNGHVFRRGCDTFIVVTNSERAVSDQHDVMVTYDQVPDVQEDGPVGLFVGCEYLSGNSASVHNGTGQVAVSAHLPDNVPDGRRIEEPSVLVRVYKNMWSWECIELRDVETVEDGYSDIVGVGILSTCFSRAGDKVAGCCGDKVLVWDIATKECIAQVRSPGIPETIAFRPSGNAVAVGTLTGYMFTFFM